MLKKINEKSKKQKLNTTAITVSVLALLREVVVALIQLIIAIIENN